MLDFSRFSPGIFQHDSRFPYYLSQSPGKARVLLGHIFVAFEVVAVGEVLDRDVPQLRES